MPKCPNCEDSRTTEYKPSMADGSGLPVLHPLLVCKKCGVVFMTMEEVKKLS